MAYKDKNKQREASKQAMRRHRASKQGMTQYLPTPGYVYIIHCVGFPYYKIGMTTGIPAKRLAVLQASLPFMLDLLAVAKTADIYADERQLHAEFDLHRVNGEWFMFSEDSLGLALERLGEIQDRRNAQGLDCFDGLPVRQLREAK